MRSVYGKKTILQLIGVVGLFVATLAAPSFSADYPDLAVLRRMGEIQKEIYNDRYEAARAACDSLIAANLSNPLPRLMLAGVLVTEMKEKEENLYEEKLFGLLEQADSLARDLSLCPIDSVRAWAFLALGHTWAYRSLWEARFGSGAQAYHRGKKAKSFYKHGLEADSTLYDLYAGMGEYNYWKSTKAGFLRSLGLIQNERQSGINQLKLASDSSLISRASARRGLMWIYLNDDQLDSTLAIARKMHREYPDGRAFVWAIAQAHFKKGEFAQAIAFFEEMRSRINAPPENYHKMISVDHFVANCYQSLELNELAWRIADRFMEYEAEISDCVRDEQHKKIKYLKKLSKQGKKERVRRAREILREETSLNMALPGRI